jgi:hypothetical protein
MIEGRDLHVAVGADAEGPHFQLAFSCPAGLSSMRTPVGARSFSPKKKLAVENLVVGKSQTERP